jgi:hypothetical protein
MKCYTIARQSDFMGSSSLPKYDVVLQHITSGFMLSPANIILPKGNTSLHSDTMWYISQDVARQIAKTDRRSVCFFLLVPPVSDIHEPQCTANFHLVDVILINIWINMPPVLC